jgi:hypothetical protein
MVRNLLVIEVPDASDEGYLSLLPVGQALSSLVVLAFVSLRE